MRYGKSLLASLENEELENTDPTAVEEELETAEGEMDDVSDVLDTENAKFDEVDDTAEELEEIHEAVEAMKEAGAENVPAYARKMVMDRLGRINRRTGLKFDSVSNESQEDFVASLEDALKDKVSKILKWIKDFFSNLGKMFKDFFNKIFSAKEKADKMTEVAKKKVKESSPQSSSEKIAIVVGGDEKEDEPAEKPTAKFTANAADFGPFRKEFENFQASKTTVISYKEFVKALFESGKLDPDAKHLGYDSPKDAARNINKVAAALNVTLMNYVDAVGKIDVAGGFAKENAGKTKKQINEAAQKEVDVSYIADAAKKAGLLKLDDVALTSPHLFECTAEDGDFHVGVNGMGYTGKDPAQLIAIFSDKSKVYDLLDVTKYNTRLTVASVEEMKKRMENLEVASESLAAGLLKEEQGRNPSVVLFRTIISDAASLVNVAKKVSMLAVKQQAAMAKLSMRICNIKASA